VIIVAATWFRMIAERWWGIDRLTAPEKAASAAPRPMID